MGIVDVLLWLPSLPSLSLLLSLLVVFYSKQLIADGLPLFHGAQLAIDTTMVSPLGRDGVPHPQCADFNGAALLAARRRKQRRYPELAGEHGRARLVCRSCLRSGREVVRRESAFPPPVVQGQGSLGTSSFAAACAPCLALPLGIHAFVQRGSGAGLIVVGREGWPRGGWTHSFG